LFLTWNEQGFVWSGGGKGWHRKFRHPSYAGSVILSGSDGDDAQYYQEKQVKTPFGKYRDESY
jgi:hypothetical protein